VHPNQIKQQWRDKLLVDVGDIFSGETKSPSTDTPVDVKTLHAKISELILENEFFRRGAHQGGVAEHKTMIDRSYQLSVTRQAKALRISRGSANYRLRPVLDAHLALMRRVDERPMDYPFAGSRMLQGLLLGEGHMVGRLHRDEAHGQ